MSEEEKARARLYRSVVALTLSAFAFGIALTNLIWSLVCA